MGLPGIPRCCLQHCQAAQDPTLTHSLLSPTSQAQLYKFFFELGQFANTYINVANVCIQELVDATAILTRMILTWPALLLAIDEFCVSLLRSTYQYIPGR